MIRGMLIARGSSYTRRVYPYMLASSQYQKSAMAVHNLNDSSDKCFDQKEVQGKRASRDREYAQSKKQVTGNVFACSCRTSTSATTATSLCNKWCSLAGYVAHFLELQLGKYTFQKLYTHVTDFYAEQ